MREKSWFAKVVVCIVRTLLLWADVVVGVVVCAVQCGKETTGGGGMWTMQVRSCGRSPFPLWSLSPRVCTLVDESQSPGQP